MDEAFSKGQQPVFSNYDVSVKESPDKTIPSLSEEKSQVS